MSGEPLHPLVRRIRFTLLWLSAIPFLIACRLLGTKTTFTLGPTTGSPTAEELADALRLISGQHDGWHHAMGPCVCEGHRKARTLLAKHGRRP